LPDVTRFPAAIRQRLGPLVAPQLPSSSDAFHHVTFLMVIFVLVCHCCYGECKRANRCQFVTICFNALHGMQTRSSDEKSVRPSICPSDA